MGQNQQSTAQQQQSVSQPWAPAIPSLQNILAQIGGGGTTTPGQGAALGALGTAAGSLPTFGPTVANAISGMFGQNYNPNIGMWQNAYNTASNTLSPYLSPGYTDPMSAPGIGTSLADLNRSITNQVKGLWAGAGRDPAGNADASRNLAQGLAAGEAPILTGEFNALAGQQQNAASQLLGGAGATAGGTAGLGQLPIQNAMAAITGALPGLPGLWTQPATTQLTAANIAQGLPYQNLQLPEQLTTNIAGLGGQVQGTGTSTTTQPVNPWTTALGAGLGLFALSDERLKTDIAPIGLLFNGLPFYRFRFKGDDKLQTGVMAQDVEKVMPEAVVDIGLWRGGPSVKAVDYARATDPMAMAA